MGLQILTSSVLLLMFKNDDYLEKETKIAAQALLLSPVWPLTWLWALGLAVKLAWKTATKDGI